MYLAPLPSTLDVTLEMAETAGVQYVVALSAAVNGKTTPTRSLHPPS